MKFQAMDKRLIAAIIITLAVGGGYLVFAGSGKDGSIHDHHPHNHPEASSAHDRSH